MSKSSNFNKVVSILKEDLRSVYEIVKEIISDLVFVLYGCFTAALTVMYLVYCSGVYTAWKPWAIIIAPYWAIGNLVLAFVSWIGYRTYQAVKNQK